MRQRTNRRQRKGSAYVLIIGVSMLAAAITIAATLAGRSQARALDGSNNASDARAYAQAAVDLGRLYITQDSNWRTNRANGTWFSGMAIGSGSMSLEVVNPNGALNRFNADPILFAGTGYCGTSVQKIQVAITPQIKAYSCLSAAMFAATCVQFQSSTFPTSGVIVASNGSLSLSQATIAPNLETAGTISFGSAHYSGTTTSGVPVRTVPGSDVFDFYTLNGTTISLSSLVNTRQFTNGVLAPTVNTMGGGTNANGIYVIDCQGQQFTINNVRICATVVLLNCGGLTVKNAVDWSPAISTLPCLLVQGTVTIKLDVPLLSEAAQFTNFNPSGIPYPWPTGTTNSLWTEVYPAGIRGLIYATGNVNFNEDGSIGMLISGGQISCSSKTISLNYSSTYLNNPPPGFYSVDMTPASMTYTQVTN